MVPDTLDATLGQPLDVCVVRLLGRAVDVRVEPEVLVALIGLGVLFLPSRNLVGIHEYGIVLDPRREFLEDLRVAVFTDSGVQTVVPVMDPADQVVASHGTVGQERPPVEAATVQHGDLFVVADHDEVDPTYEGVSGLAVLQITPSGDFHRVAGI